MMLPGFWLRRFLALVTYMPEFELFELDANSIKDFQTCALLYRYRHVDKMYESIGSRDLMSIKYENTLKKLIAFFFYKKQGGIVPSVSALLNRWEKLWFPKDMSAYDIAVEKHESLWGNVSSMNTKAVSCIMKFYEDFSLDNRDPIVINEGFTTALDREIRLNGVFDVVLRDPKTRDISVIKWLSSPKRANLSGLSIDFSILRYAFETKNKNLKGLVNYYAYDIGSDKNEFIQIDVKDEDINNLKYWARQVDKTEIFAPRRGLTSYCKKCPFDDPCKKFSITSEMM